MGFNSGFKGLIKSSRTFKLTPQDAAITVSVSRFDSTMKQPVAIYLVKDVNFIIGTDDV